MMVESAPVSTGGEHGDQGQLQGSLGAAGGGAASKQANEANKKVVYTYPMVKESDMNEDMRGEVLEICGNACEKHATNNESAAKLIKETMDKKFGNSWHVVVGEGFGFEVSYEVSSLMYMFFAGNLAVCVWKCS